MSTVDRPGSRAFPPLADGERLDQPTFHARYAAMTEDVRAELVDGVVYMASPLGLHHGSMDHDLAFWLTSYRRRTPGVICAANATVKLGDDAEVQPDAQLLILEGHGGQSRVVGDYVVGAPELVIEVGQSSRAYDLGIKKDQYERSGVLEYLFVGVAPDEAIWFARRAGRFEALAPGDDKILRSGAFPGLWLDASALYADDLDALIAALERGLATPEHAAFVASLNARHADR